MTARTPSALPRAGQTVHYINAGVRCTGTWLSQLVQPIHDQDGSRIKMPVTSSWVMAIDGVVLVARVRGEWWVIDRPSGLADPGTRLATRHRPAPVEIQQELGA